jgi:hypothetical protein
MTNYVHEHNDIHKIYCPQMITWAFVYITKTNNNAKNRLGRSMPQTIKMKIKLHVIICLVSAVGWATVSVRCFSRTDRTSITCQTHFFYLRSVNCSENKFDRFFIYIHEYEIEYFITMRSNRIEIKIINIYYKIYIIRRKQMENEK